MKRFRFSLLSLLVGVMLAGGVVWLNVQPLGVYASARVAITQEPVEFQIGAHYGWPLHAYYKRRDKLISGRSRVTWSAAAIDIAIGLAIVFGGAGVCEYVVRRRTKKAET